MPEESVQPGQGQGTETETATTEGTDVQAAQPTAVEPTQGSGPWANDLAEVFADEAIREQVDGFLRERVQPYVTQVEQRSQVAGQLYEDLSNTPGPTYLAITEELFGDEVATEIHQMLLKRFGESDEQAPAPEAQAPAATEAPQQGDLDPRVKAVVDHYEKEQREAQYNALIKAAVDKHPDIKPDYFHPFVAAANGDTELAYAGYKAWRDGMLADHQAQTEGEQTAQPPAVLGSDTRTPTTPPTEKKYKSMDEAIDDTIAELRQGAPLTVGSA